MKNLLISLSIVGILLAACGAADIQAAQTAVAEADLANQEFATANAQWALEYAELADELDQVQDALGTANAPVVTTDTPDPTATSVVIVCADFDQASRLSFGYVIGVGKSNERVAFSESEDCIFALYSFTDGGLLSVRVSENGETFSSCVYTSPEGERVSCTLQFTREFTAPNLNAAGSTGDLTICLAETALSYNEFSGCGK